MNKVLNFLKDIFSPSEELAFTKMMNCSNCGYTFNQSFPKGTPVGMVNQCPNCGCNTAY